MELSLGEKIMLLRKKKGLTQVELAEELGVNQVNITSYENERYKPSLELIVKIADLFEVTTDYLLRGSSSSLHKE